MHLQHSLMILIMSIMPLSQLWAQSLHRCDGYLSDESSFSQPKSGEYDCTERTDTGYVDGDAFPIVVVTVDGKPAELESANAYWVMKQAALADGVELDVSSGFRTWEEQEYFYNCYINQNCNGGNLAARPGYSNHQSGHAFDLNTSDGGVYDWLNNNAARFGFERTVPSEPWHWEWWGGGPGGGPCTSEPCQILSAEGGILDDSGPCFQKFGSAMYWRQVDGEGENGGLHWTNAYDDMTPGNWARWQIHLSEAGEYLLEVSVSPQYGICTQTPYLVRHSENETSVTLDQSSPDYWQSLGTFNFAAEGVQYVDVYDNIPGWSLQDQRITADAIRLTRQGLEQENMNMAGMEMEIDPMNAGDEMSMEVDGMNAGEGAAGTDMANGGEMASGTTSEMNEPTVAGEEPNSEEDSRNEGQYREGMEAEFHQLQESENNKSASGSMSCAHLHSSTQSKRSSFIPLYFYLICILCSLNLIRRTNV